MVRPCVASSFDDLADVGPASMYPAFDWSGLCSRPRWISARVRPLEPTGLKWAIRRKPVFACAGKTDPPLRFNHSQTSAGKRLRHWQVLHLSRSFVRAERRSSVPAGIRRAPRGGAVKTGRRPSPKAARSGLDGPEHGARITRAGRLHDRCSCSRSPGPWPRPPRRCEPICSRARPPARCDAIVSWRPRSRL